MELCRNCGSNDLKQLGFAGTLNPFFLRRVFHAEVIQTASSNPYKKLIQKGTQFGQKILRRISKPMVAVEVQYCLSCSFVQTRFPFNSDALGNLYADYRSESYNRDRIHYEPHYAAIAEEMGEYDHIGKGRVASLTSWLKEVAAAEYTSMLDYGGADGKYLPDLPAERYVYEISDIPPAAGVTRIATREELGQYDYVQIAHVLEHVPYPLQMLKEAISMTRVNGHIMVEVPQDVEPDGLKEIAAGMRQVGIHEHINLYSVRAVTKLVEAAGLETISVNAIPIKAPNATQFFIRALAKRIV